MSDITERLAAALAERYRIERELGQGGMATVYLAEDLRHKRKVAVKVLRPELAAVLGADRFVQEITTTAALQHPHILPLFDSGTADGFLYYVMPFIQGETLRDKLSRETQLGVEEAVRIAREVAGALDYAHRHGVIHRDIKPENILLHDGRPMVADFGIALAVSAAAGGRMTETGLSLGTPHYMSPEQATAAKEITARSDVYSLGSVLYEMLAGEPPHSGGSAQQVIMKIIAEEAQPVTRLRKAVPANVAAAVAKSLEKLPADRFASAALFADALGNQSFTTGAAAPTPAASEKRKRSRVVEAAVWFAAGGIAAAIGFRQSRPGAAAPSDERLQVTYSGRAVSPAISADGRFVAYLETRCPEPPARGGCANLHVIEAGSTRPVEIIAGADRLSSPRWTHDGLALVVAGALGEGRTGLFTVPRLGGIPRRIADDPLSFDTHPSSDSVAIVMLRDSGTVLRVVDIASGRAGAEVAFAISPIAIAWSPDGQRFAASGNDQLSVLGRDGALISSAERTGTRSTARWSADGGHILMFRWTAGEEDDLVAFPVARNGRLGTPRLVASKLSTLLEGRFDVARATGRVVIGSGAVFSDVWSFDLMGTGTRARRITQGTNWYGPPILTADGRGLYYLRADPVGNSLYRVSDGRETAVTAEPQMVNSNLRLTLDQRVISFESRVDTSNVLMVHDIASGTSRQVPRGADDMGWVLPGGGEIAWLGPDASTVWITDASGGNRRDLPTPWSRNEAASFIGGVYFGGVWFLAPDGASLAVLRHLRDEARLYRVPLRGGAAALLGRFPATEGGVGMAAWTPDGSLTLARRHPASVTTSLLRFDLRTGATRPSAELPAACVPTAVTLAADGGRAACLVRDQRADLILIDGLRP